MSHDKQETLYERAVQGWTDLSRRSFSDASRLASSLTEAGSRLMLDTGRTLGTWASQVGAAAGKARDLVAREREAGKSRGQVVGDIAAQLGSAYGAAVLGYGKAVRQSVEHFAWRYSHRDADAASSPSASAASAGAPEPGIGTSPRATGVRPE